MSDLVEYFPGAIKIRSRELLDYLTLGRWHRECVLDEERRVVVEVLVRPWKITSYEYSWKMFEAVDYSYKLLNSVTRDGVQHDFEQFSVGLRWKGSWQVLPLALFRGGTSTPVGLGEVVASLLPDSWNPAPKITHEVASRSLANMLCQKMGLKLAM